MIAVSSGDFLLSLFEVHVEWLMFAKTTNGNQDKKKHQKKPSFHGKITDTFENIQLEIFGTE